MPLRRRLRPDSGDARGAGGDGRHHGAIEEVVFPAGEEVPLVDGAAAGADGDRLLARQVVEEHVMLRLVAGEGARIADGCSEPGGQEGFPVARVEEQPALAADGADLPAGADPLAGLFLPVVNGAGRPAGSRSRPVCCGLKPPHSPEGEAHPGSSAPGENRERGRTGEEGLTASRRSGRFPGCFPPACRCD